MNGIHITRPFERMGARVEQYEMRDPRGVRVDIRSDRLGQKFELGVGTGVDLHIVDVQPGARHLLVACKVIDTGERHKFLCGHDEREWFAAAVPNGRGVSNVRTAIEALKPADVRTEVERLGVSHKEYASRRTKAYLRQGEWFFLPRPDLTVKRGLIFRNEPLQRGRGKPHLAEFACRHGGEAVYVARHHPQGLTLEEYRALLKSRPSEAQASWRLARRNAEVYVKGRIRHPDHATIILPFWHLVRMNTENFAPSMRHLSFID
jgi:hypothetical protein